MKILHHGTLGDQTASREMCNAVRFYDKSKRNYSASLDTKLQQLSRLKPNVFIDSIFNGALKDIQIICYNVQSLTLCDPALRGSM